MEKLDISKTITIAFVIIIGLYFFGGKAISFYDHKDDMSFSMEKLVYTKADFNLLSSVEQESMIRELSTVCINKHHIDKISCADTAYWLAHALEDEGIDTDLAISWMAPCEEHCATGKYIAPVVPKNETKSEGTKWIWEEN